MGTIGPHKAAGFTPELPVLGSPEMFRGLADMFRDHINGNTEFSDAQTVIDNTLLKGGEDPEGWARFFDELAETYRARS